MKPVFIVFILLFFLKQNFAQETITISNDSEIEFLNLNKHLQVFEDETAAMEIREIITSQKPLFKPFEEVKTEFKPKSALWGKLIINNQTNEQKNYLLISDRGNIISMNNYVNVYVLDDKIRLAEMINGKLLPLSQKSYENNAVNAFTINIPAKKVLSFYIQIRNVNNYAPKFDLSLENQSKFEKNYSEKIAQKNLIQGIFQGIIWIIFLYAVIMFFIHNNRLFLLYALYLSLIGIDMLNRFDLFGELTNEKPKLYFYINFLAVNLSLIAYSEFVRKYLNVSKNNPVWNKVFQALVIVMIVNVINSFLIIYNSFDIPLYRNIGNIVIMIFNFTIGAYLISQIHDAQGSKKIFIAGGLVFCLGFFIQTFLFYKGIAALNNANILQLSTLIEIVIFTIALNINMKEKRLAESPKLEE